MRTALVVRSGMRRVLRSPFLVTFAASASLGCGSTSADEPTVVEGLPGNPPEVEAPLPPGNPPPVVDACPSPGAPEVGQGCVGALLCHYGSTDPCEATYLDYRCVNGHFEVAERPTCNPPPPPAATSKP